MQRSSSARVFEFFSLVTFSRLYLSFVSFRSPSNHKRAARKMNVREFSEKGDVDLKFCKIVASNHQESATNITKNLTIYKSRKYRLHGRSFVSISELNLTLLEYACTSILNNPESSVKIFAESWSCLQILVCHGIKIVAWLHTSEL